MKNKKHLEDGLKLLVVSPHPDDAELGLAGVILKAKARGQKVVLVDLTSGEPTPCGSEEKRKKETAAATELLKIDRRINLGLPNRYLFDGREARNLVAEEIRREQPDILLVPYPADAHPDHLAATRIAEAARFYAKFTKVDLKGERCYPPVLLYYICSHLRILPRISFLIDTTQFFEDKLKIIKCYRSQFIDNPANRFVFNYIRARDSYWGSLIGTQYAEAIYSKEAVKISDLATLL